MNNTKRKYNKSRKEESHLESSNTTIEGINNIENEVFFAIHCLDPQFDITAIKEDDKIDCVKILIVKIVEELIQRIVYSLYERVLSAFEKHLKRFKNIGIYKRGKKASIGNAYDSI